MGTVIYGNSSIKSAFDMALLDIASQHAGLPLYKYLRRLRRESDSYRMKTKEDKWKVPDDDKPNKEIHTDYTISLGEPEKMAADALRFAAMGFPVIKVKVGGEPKKDIERVKAVRKAIGDDMGLRIDANQGWKGK